MDFNVSIYIYLEAMLKYVIPEFALYNYNFFLIFSSSIFCLVSPFVDKHRLIVIYHLFIHLTVPLYLKYISYKEHTVGFS